MIMHGQCMESIVFYSTSIVRWCVVQVLHAISQHLPALVRRSASAEVLLATLRFLVLGDGDGAGVIIYGVDENVDETGQLCRSICISSISSQFASCFTFASQFPSLCGSHVSFRETYKAF